MLWSEHPPAKHSLNAGASTTYPAVAGSSHQHHEAGTLHRSTVPADTNGPSHLHVGAQDQHEAVIAGTLHRGTVPAGMPRGSS